MRPRALPAPRALLAGLLTGLVALALAGCEGAAGPPAEASDDASAPRVVALGGAVAETVYALGAEGLLVARDASAVYPPAVLGKPSVGYFRQLGAEGVLSTAPTLVLADPEAGPPAVLDQIEAAGVGVVRLPGGATPADAAAQIRAVAAALGREAAGEALVDTLEAQLAEAAALVARAEAASGAASGRRPRVLFVLGQGGGTVSLSGAGTQADAFVRLSGGENAFGAVEGYKPMTPEALVEAAPDVVFMLGRTAEAVGGPEAFARQPALAATPAARDGRVVVLPDHALNFGPGLGAHVLAFARTLYPDAAR
ncbi:MAG TPA: ABC transporter substrate-binding protein, partial [Rubricoccaceae bacterium]|nr:ABC transporter substrate-binding protein [Rubricoccaceae bacterium]